MEQYKRVSLKDLENNPWQPREVFDREQLRGLADSIKQIGMVQPGVARPHPKKRDVFQLAAGARRKEASHLAGVKDMPIVIRDLDDKTMRLYAIAENIHRADLLPAEKEKAIYALWTSHYKEEFAGRTPGRHADGVHAGVAQLTKDLGYSAESVVTEILTAHEARLKLELGPEPSTKDIARVAFLAKEDPRTAKRLIEARAADKIDAVSLREIMPTIREASKEDRKAIVTGVLKAREQAEGYVKDVQEEIQHGKTVIREVTPADERRLRRLGDLYWQLQLYAAWEYIGGIDDPKTRDKATAVLEDMEKWLKEQLELTQRWAAKGR